MTDYSFQTLHSDGGARVIFRGVVGSRAYGTDRPLDYISLAALGTRAREKSAFDAALAAWRGRTTTCAVLPFGPGSGRLGGVNEGRTICHVVAGPDGSGKPTFALRRLTRRAGTVEHVNPGILSPS